MNQTSFTHPEGISVDDPYVSEMLKLVRRRALLEHVVRAYDGGGQFSAVLTESDDKSWRWVTS